VIITHDLFVFCRSSSIIISVIYGIIFSSIISFNQSSVQLDAMTKLCLIVLLPLLFSGQVNAAFNATSAANSTSSNITNISSSESPSQAPSYYDPFVPLTVFIPPWGETAFGGFGNSGYRFSGLSDIRRNGWSWTSSSLSKSAPFCYDIQPRPFGEDNGVGNSGTGGLTSTCYTTGVIEMCTNLGGTASYANTMCIADPSKPFEVVGPVCWNQTCYNEKTFATCKALGGQFVGGQYNSRYNGHIINTTDYREPPYSDAAWCAVPGKHTVVGPACYGQECFKDELATACKSLGGTSFADIFCLLDDSYTVIGPICKPTENYTENASVCYPDETAKLCQEMDGTNIGDIFCIVKGEYSVLGPFCHVDYVKDDANITETVYPICTNGTDVCTNLGGKSMADGTFCILEENDYTLMGPFCFVSGCYSVPTTEEGYTESTCDSLLGGTTLGDFSCILKGDYTVVGPLAWGDGTDLLFFNGYELGKDLDQSSIIFPLKGAMPAWILLNGKFSVYGPTCYGSSCNTGNEDCMAAGGSNFGNTFCLVLDVSTSPTSGPISLTSEATFTVASPAFGLLYVMVSMSMIFGIW